MKEKFLPIGTVVTLKGSDKPLMITEHIVFSQKTGEAKTYDYGSCPFPTGVQKNLSIDFTLSPISPNKLIKAVKDEPFKTKPISNVSLSYGVRER